MNSLGMVLELVVMMLAVGMVKDGDGVGSFG